MKKIKSLSIIALAAALTLSGCGQSATTGSSESSVEAAATAVATPVDGDMPKVEGGDGAEPVIHPAKGKEPTELVSEVLKKGDGEEIKPDDTLKVNYLGQLWNGTVFDKSYGREPATFSLDGVITGWKKGLAGKHVGDRVLLLVPAADGYGAAGSPPTIPENATLVFVVDILERKDAAQAAEEQKQQEEKEKARQEAIEKLLPEVDKAGQEALKAAKPVDFKLPEGITIENNQDGAPKITVSKDAKLDQDDLLVKMLDGTGPVIGKADPFLCNVTVAAEGQEQTTTWGNNGRTIQQAPPAEQMGPEFVDARVGSRIARLHKNEKGGVTVSVVDIISPIPEALKKLQ
ncbi:hypothetical protein BK816_04805 [Boudabousia tangfeifanii]|uniref:peptidylprolyl isomerase n=1 Tax=Boudabousia tangfeifanii TaxID=1912795 RepID=A0A1D9MKI7_9ACTO|nr:FKBP-type peptidyl-prolyl cis-trans isomerase [Boudabousia tangfeifanii]AOZ72693.1 hypothetical protein BK816_04805 [Boudabousia tangfeifanii]